MLDENESRRPDEPHGNVKADLGPLPLCTGATSGVEGIFGIWQAPIVDIPGSTASRGNAFTIELDNMVT